MKTKFDFPIFIALFILLLIIPGKDLQAQKTEINSGGGESNPGLFTNAKSLEHWKDMRFGMFIHWGPVTLRGTEIGWSRGENVKVEDYDNLYREFNPVLFNAADWVKTAKDAGMRYIVFVSKHHDGFTMWDSKLTNYKITATLLVKMYSGKFPMNAESRAYSFAHTIP